jgi:hypothetical protein
MVIREIRCGVVNRPRTQNGVRSCFCERDKKNLRVTEKRKDLLSNWLRKTLHHED